MTFFSTVCVRAIEIQNRPDQWMQIFPNPIVI